MAAKIKLTLGTEPKLVPKGGGIFDVVVGDEIVYSKFKTGTFPDEEQLINELVATYPHFSGPRVSPRASVDHRTVAE